MKTRILGLALIGGLLVGNALIAGDQLRSGLPVGGSPSPFHPLTVFCPENADFVGNRIDYVGDEYGGNPVVLIFARKLSDPLAKLVKQIDAKVGENTAKRARALLVMLSDEDSRDKDLKSFGETQRLKHFSLAADNIHGPRAYKLDREAEVTFMLYVKGTVISNSAFRKGGLNDKAMARLIVDVEKMLPPEAPK